MVYNRLKDELVFPFVAKVVDVNDNILHGQKLVITQVDNYVDMYGVLMEAKVGRRKYIVALCELDITDTKSKNYKLVEEYLEWFG
ncbi:MAG: calcium-binding protein [Bacteroidota bacterium]